MANNLVIVESPAKAKTIEKYLGKEFRVLASYGHVRDLIPKEGAVDPDDSFAMKYAVIDRNEKHVNAIGRALKKADALYLATDPDREGEAIAWHLYEILRERGLTDGKDVHRVVFYEITRHAVDEAIGDPRSLSNDLVNAQQARRALDYLVGFNLSPLLWKKIRPGLSAGRVQSPALRMIVEREAEIEAFVPQEYWSIEADVAKDGTEFVARLAEYQGEKVRQFTFTSETEAREVEQTLLSGANGKLSVASIEKKQRRRRAPPPFTTSTLQQEASRKLRFGAQRTMRVAQRLYEGIDTGDGAEGLITYMRTDSVALAGEAVDELRSVIGQRFGKESVPEKPNVYRTKAKNAQEAHEAIRPTSAARSPESLKGHIEEDQLRLYTLIWQRTMACQMIPALYDTVVLDLLAGPDGEKRNRLRANGSVLVKPGFLAVYKDKSDGAEGDRILPPMQQGEQIELLKVRPEQHFTEPPPRFSEASLVKALEEYGIGRPSTYANIISTLVNREYVELESRRFRPTDVGKIVNGFLTEHFERYVDYDFTARLEDDLDAVSRGEKDWLPLMKNFWSPFKKRVADKDKSVTREQVAKARQLGTDPKTGKPVSVRMGRFGPFVQIGSKEDEDKPKFAGLRPGQKMDEVTLDDALELFKLPRKLGATPEGEPVSASVGRFGPYVKYGSKFASIKNDDPYTISLERALEVIAQKKEADANRLIRDFPEDGIQVLRGRYGPYITDKKKNARVPKDREPESLTLEECRKLLAEAPERGRRGKKTAKKSTSKKTAKKKTSRKKATKRKTAKKKRKKAASKRTPRKKAAGG